MKINGIFNGSFRFRDEKTGYSGFSIKTQDDYGNESFIFCKGKIQHLVDNIPIELEGDYTNDNQGRSCFAFKEYSFETHNKTNEILFLVSLGIEGFNIKKATELLDYFGDSIFSVIKDCKKCLVFKSRMPKKYEEFASKIFSKIHSIMSLKDIYFEVMRVGGDYTNASLLITKFGTDSLNKLKYDPYKYGYMIGLSFKSCELLAYKAGYTYLSEVRALGVMYYALDVIESSGNTYATTKEFKSICAKIQNKSLLGLTSPDYTLACAVLNKDVIIDNDRVYKRKTKIYEEVLADNINRLQRTGVPLGLDVDLIKELEDKNHVTLSDSQRNAINALSSSGVKVITGGPGAGKTTLTNIIIQYCEKKYPDRGIVLCAPTGCAAQNMSTKTDHLAETIHKTLGIKPFGNDEIRITKKRIEKIYIIDESSMMDLEVAKILFQSIPNDSIVLLVGDVDQLPSVQAGNVLQDLIDAGFETYRLEGSFRQANGSAIIENAYKIKNGDLDLNIKGKDFAILEATNDKDAVDLCLTLATDDNCQVLCPTRKHDVGSKELSNKIQEVRGGKFGPSKKVGTVTYYIEDKVIMTKNNYSVGYYNGEAGVISEIDDYGITIDFYNGDTVYVTSANYGDMALAYALTVHKSQGAEYKNVYILLPSKASAMMNRNLLYTAVTRAKEKVVVISVGDSLNKAITSKAIKRHSGLADLLQSEAK